MYFDSKPLWSVIIYLEDKKCVHKIRNATWYKCNAVIFFFIPTKSQNIYMRNQPGNPYGMYSQTAIYTLFVTHAVLLHLSLITFHL